MPTTETVGFPLSPQQERILSLDSSHHVFPYVTQLKLSITGTVDQGRLEKAVARVIAKHEILRTRFVPHPALRTLLQVIAPEGSFAAETAQLPPEAAHNGLPAAHSGGPFNLSEGGLLRCVLAHFPPEKSVFYLTLPSICADAATMRIIARDLAAAYEHPDSSLLESGEIQYADVAEHFNALLQSDLGSMGKQYWHPRLAGSQAPSVQPDGARAGTAGHFSPQAVHGRIEAEVLAKAAGAFGPDFSEEVFLLACWQVLLAQLSGVSEFVVGYAAAGRDMPELETCAGPFERYLPLAGAAGVNLSFAEFLGKTGETLNECLQWQNSFQWPEQENYHPVCFSYYDASWSFAAGDARFSCAFLNSCADRFQLKLSCARSGDAIAVDLFYDPSLYSEQSARQIVEQFHTLTQSAGLAPQQPVSEINAVSPQERQRLVRQFSSSDVALGFEDVVARFEQQASSAPESMALVCNQKRLSYGDLNQKANQLAHYLAHLGAGPESRVAICMERSPEMVVALLGTLKAGAAYVPLDPAYPSERMAYMLKDASVTLVLTEEHLAQRLPQEEAKIVPLDRECNAVAGHSSSNPAITIAEQNLAYVIYTSGSTGRPKGVAVTRKGLANYVNWACRSYEFQAGSCSPLYSSIGFDLTVTSLWPCLVAGGYVIVAPEIQGIDAIAKLEAEDQPYGVLKITPAHLQMLKSVLPEEKAGISSRFVIGGEALGWSDLSYWRKHAPGTRLINEYGPTETVVGSCIYEVRDQDGEPEGQVPVGRPIASTQVYVLNGNGDLCATGAPGELYIGGAGVARGYLNHPELTAERFVPDSFGGQPGERLYRTGDLARWRADGQLIFMGRLDDQVKIRGFRIELGEIEALIKEDENIETAAVVVREDEPGNKQLVAYVVPKSPLSAIQLDHLSAYLKERLPEYMAPAAIVELPKLPLTTNGKLDRKALPKPEPRAASGGEGDSPRSIVEEIVAGIWSEVLRREPIGRDANFFELGGHSLLATQVISRLRNIFDVELPLRALFATPTVAGLAAQVRKLRDPIREPIAARHAEIAPLSHAQQRLWSIEREGATNPLRNLGFAVRLTGSLNQHALASALNQVVRRHEVLRARFVERGGIPVQEVLPAINMEIEQIDARGLNADELKKIAEAKIQQRFDVAQGPMIRAALLSNGAQEHVLVLAVHAIACDAASLDLIHHELAQLYSAGSEGTSQLPELELQFGDFAAWEQSVITEPVLEKQVGYWKTQLQGASPLELPVDHSQSSAQGHGEVPLEIPFQQMQKLKEFSRQEGATLSITLLAAFHVLLSKHSGQADIVTGFGASRAYPEIARTVGVFADEFIVRADLSGNPAFRDVVARERRAVLEGQERQDVSFARIAEDLQIPSGEEVKFSLLPSLGSDTAWGKAQAEPFVVSTRAQGLKLFFEFRETSTGLRGTLHYAARLFSSAKAERLIGHYKHLLEICVKDASEPISLLSVMPEAERQQVLTEWNNTRAEYPDTCAHELFEEQAARTPNAIAVEFEGQKLTYSELNQRANQLANYLKKLGVGPETLVGICVERSLEMMVGLLGVLKAGGAYLPLDPNYPTERIRYVLEDSEASVLLTQKAIVRQLPYFDGAVVRLDDQWAKIGKEKTGNVESSANPTNLAYVIYTSGSTGKPKGVQVSHRALVNFLASISRKPGIAEHDVLLAVTTLSFDIAGLELYLPLIAGGQMKLLSREAVIDGRRLLSEISQGVTIMQATPATWLLLLEAGWTGTPGLKALCGGEALKPDLARKLVEFSGSAWNMYGPTETTIWSLMEELQVGQDRVSIGRPVANTSAYVLDQELMPVPRGVVGELFIGGDGLARGYIKRSDLTAERFVPDPFAQTEGGRLYRTGDLVRCSEAGRLEFVGRADHQVKVRGYRIELGEIEAVLLEIDQVKQAAVAARDDARGEKQLIAYLVASREITVGELREALKRELPDYMLPSMVVMLDALPLTANGKIDRRALPAPVRDSGRDENRAAPRTQVEQIVADAWAGVLQAPRLGTKDNFFDFGATSLLVTRALSRLRSAFNLDIPVRTVFEAPTVEALAVAIELQIQSGSNSAVSPVRPVERSGNLPLSYSQQRLWLYDQLEPGAPVNVPFGVRLRGELQKQVLRRTLNEIVRRHEVLRTRYVERDGGPVQEIVAEMPLEIQEIDLRNLPEGEREEAARELAFEEAKASFDLGRGPVLRVKLLILSDRDYVLLPTMHHIVSDGWSLEVMMREFTALYQAYCAGQPSPLPELNIQYADYAVWQRDWLQGTVLNEQLKYWRAQLAGLPRLEMPTDFPRPAVPSGRGDNVRFELGRDFTEKLKRFSRQHGVTQYMTLLAALQVLLARYSGQKDIAVGTDVANRRQLELEPLVGFFVNQVVVRSNLGGDATFLEVLQRVRQTTLDAFLHEDVPYERVVEDLQPERRTTDGPLFQVKLVMQNAVRQDSRIVGLEVERFEIELDRVWLDLELVLAEVPAGIKGVLHYARDLFKHATAERIVAHYKAVLEAALNNPHERISKLSFRQEQEQRLVARPRSENPPLSFAQQRMWFIHELEPESTAYNAHVPLRLAGTLDKEALSHSINEIVRRHEVLRTTFPVKNGGPVQMIAPQLEVPIVEEDLTSWPEADREEEAKRRARAEAERPFDLAHGPVLRVKLLCLSEQDYVLLLTMHHIVSDGWSIGVLTREVGLLYEAYRTGRPSPLPELAIQYADYALWQREWLQGEVLHEQLGYWKKQLAGVPALELPTDHPRPAKMSYRGSTARFRLSSELTEKLNRFSQGHGVTLFMSLLAGLQIVLSKYAGQQDIAVGTAVANRNRVEIEGLIGFFLNTLVLRTDLSGDPTLSEALQRVQQVALDAYRHQDLPFEKLVEELQPERDMSRTPFFQVMLLLQNMELKHLQLPGLTLSPFDSVPDGVKFDLSLAMMEQDGALSGLLTYASDLYEIETIERMTEHFRLVLETIVEDSARRISDTSCLTEQERRQVLLGWNETYAAPVEKCIHELFEEQARRTPQNIAVLFEGQAITYGELNEKANHVAHYLQQLGAGLERIVGICVERSPEMLIGMLGILKAGAAYLPLEPSLPAARLGFMIEDSRISLLLTQDRLLGTLPETACKLVCLDRDWDKIAASPAIDPNISINGHNLAYAMYTSGSTGKPKGVMIEHRGVVNFFTGMDQSVHCGPEDTLLAVTGFAFDISVLELFWTLTRGAKVVLVADVLEGQQHAAPASAPASAELDYSLFYFSSADVQQVPGKYRLLLEGARYADKNGFSAVWTPERHFHQFGGLYPNPSVTGAAVAAVTERIQVRAGSVVLPLHNVVRVAEEWSVVDNLSGGRVGLAFASGWHADDFIFAPQNYKERRDITFESIKTFLKLWKGEPVKALSGNGKEIEVKIFPRPIQEQPPVWITAAGTPDTFIKAGQMGANVLTHLLGQSVDEVAEKIKVYREALAQAGHDPEKGQVALMLHTFLGSDKGKVLDQVRIPFTEYLRSSVDLIKNLTSSANLPSDVQQLSPKDMEALLAFAFDRYSEGSALFGTVKSVAPMIEHLKEIGVTEVAALVDFGVDENEVLQGFDYLAALKTPAISIGPRTPKSLSALAVEHQVTLLQCTPAMLRMLTGGRDGLAPFSSLRALMVGGESLPPTLAGEVKKTLPCKLINMYGPTETTIWSATGEIAEPERITVGRPIANTQIYILDRNGGTPVPAGVTGELYIGGTGVARGYLHRPDLTADRFVPDCFSLQPGGRLYRTGDLARYQRDGAIEVLGRVDHQIKVRGRRIELEEIEAALTRHPQVQAAAVTARGDSGEDKHLVGYIVAQREPPVTSSSLREYLKNELPDYMVPSHFMFLDRLPLTSNGKLDRKSLPVFEAQRAESARPYVPPGTEVERAIADIWMEVLRVPKVAVDDNFFELGGHSLSATLVVSRIRAACRVDVPLKIIFEQPTLAGLSRRIEEQQAATASQEKINEPPVFSEAAIDQTLTGLENLSDDEIELLLSMENDSR